MKRWGLVGIGALALGACGSSTKAAAPTDAPTTVTTSTTGAIVTTTTVAVTVASPTIAATTTAAPATTTTTTSAPVTTTTTVAPTDPPTTVDPMKAAADFYLFTATAANNQYDNIAKRYPGTTIAWKNWPAYCAELAAVDDTFAKGLAGYSWPANVEATLKAQEAVEAELAGIEYTCSHTKGTFGAMSPVLAASRAASDRESAAASATRLALGLPLDR